MARTLLTRPDQNPKTKKGMKKRYMTFPLHLAPANLSGFNVCPMAGACKKACLNLAGRGIFNSVQAARIARTQWFFADRDAFMAQLVEEIRASQRYATRRKMALAIRLNATSDIPWHRIPVDDAANIMTLFPNVQFYDYTKVAKRIFEQRPANYHLTFSADERNHADVLKVLEAGGNVAMVFRSRALVETLLGSSYNGATVIDGDETDLRFLDPTRSIVALYAKGPAKSDISGFVRDALN